MAGEVTAAGQPGGPPPSRSTPRRPRSIRHPGVAAARPFGTRKPWSPPASQWKETGPGMVRDQCSRSALPARASRSPLTNSTGSFKRGKWSTRRLLGLPGRMERIAEEQQPEGGERILGVGRRPGSSTDRPWTVRRARADPAAGR